MGSRRRRVDPHGLLIARLTGITGRYAGRMAAGREVDQEAAVAELREISTDPEALAEVAAFYDSDDGCHYRAQAVALLIRAGAASGSLARYVEQWRKTRSGFDMAEFADAMNRSGVTLPHPRGSEGAHEQGGDDAGGDEQRHAEDGHH